jgi:hypothetical protein
MDALYILYVETARRGFTRQDEMRSGRWSFLELLRMGARRAVRLVSKIKVVHAYGIMWRNVTYDVNREDHEENFGTITDRYRSTDKTVHGYLAIRCYDLLRFQRPY